MYKARLVSISRILDIPNKDRIVAAELNEVPGLRVIVGKDYTQDIRYVYFHPDIQLSENFCKSNDLFPRYENGVRVGGGYFDENRRVKCQKFAGIRSEGFLCDISYFDYLKDPQAVAELFNQELGFEFDRVGTERICRKYIIRGKRREKTKFDKFIEYLDTTRFHSLAPKLVRIRNKSEDLYYQTKDKVETLIAQFNIYAYNSLFQRHPDTEQLRDYVRNIPVGAEIIVTEKLHGTSGRFARLPDTSIKGRISSLLGKDTYRTYVGTRNVVLKDNQHDPYYGSGEVFRWDIAKKFKNAENGEDFSHEIVGFTTLGQPLMTIHNLDKIKRDYKSVKNFPNPMVYSYGLDNGCEEYVYKYSKLENGRVVVKDWDTTVARCKELGVKTVPELDRFIYDGDIDKFLERVNKFLSNDDLIPSTLDKRHITEGICIRIQTKDENDNYISMWEVLKHKSFIFGILEGYIKESGIEDNN